MNRTDFLEALGRALQGMDDRDRQDALNYFDELIADTMDERGVSEEEAVAGLGGVEQIAAGIRQAPVREAESRPAAAGQPTPPDDSPGLKVVTARAAAVRSLTIHSANTRVTVVAGDRDEVELSYEQDERNIYDFSLEGGEMRLILRQPEGFHIMDFLRLNRPTPEIRVVAPADFAASCDLRTSNGAIDIDGISLWGRLRARTSNSGISLQHLRCEGDLALRTSNSGIRLRQVSARGEAEARTSNSRLSALELKARQITLTTSNSKLTAEDLVSEGKIVLTTSNGRLEASRLQSPVSLSLGTSNSRLQFSGLDAPSITLRTSNGAVSGSVAGSAQDYSVTSHTSRGRDSLRDHRAQGSRRLDVQTSNGAILVDFEG